MNPILLRDLISDFCFEYSVFYSNKIASITNTQSLNYSKKERSLNEEADNIKYFHKKYLKFIKENQLTNAEIDLFIEDVLRSFKDIEVRLSDAYESIKKKGDSWFVVISVQPTTKIILYLELELDKIRKTGLLTTNEFAESKKVNSGYSWENKTELSELIHVLYKSERIKKNGVAIEKQELTRLFQDLFRFNKFNPIDLLNKSVKSYKKGDDGKSFINELNEYMKDYIKSIKEKERK